MSDRHYDPGGLLLQAPLEVLEVSSSQRSLFLTSDSHSCSIAADPIKGQGATVELGEELDEHGPGLNPDCSRYASEPQS